MNINIVLVIAALVFLRFNIASIRRGYLNGRAWQVRQGYVGIVATALFAIAHFSPEPLRHHLVIAGVVVLVIYFALSPRIKQERWGA